MVVIYLHNFLTTTNYKLICKSCSLGAEAFASRKICEIFAFREHKLSRIGLNRYFLRLKLSQMDRKVDFFCCFKETCGSR